MRHYFILPVLSLVVLGASRGELFAQGQTVRDLPEEPAMWINSKPLSPEALSGKGVFLWFFEETCPSCARRWPELMAFSKSYQGQPVVFIAVNSGTSRPTIEAYVRKNKITWPVMLDPSRALETTFETNEISLNNIHQARIILPDSTWQRASFSDLDSGVKRALADAKWNIDPDNIPRELFAAWQAIEFGNFSTGAVAIQKALKSSKSDVKQAAELLHQYVQQKLEEQLKKATEALEADRKWEAYKAYQQISTTFKGHSLPDDVASHLKTLEKDQVVEQELKALRILGLARKALDGTPSGQRKANNLLKTIRDDYPMTEAALLAGEQVQDP